MLAAALAALATLALAPPAVAGKKERPTGTVFLPNPVVVLEDQSLTDQGDADYPALAGAYQVVRLRNLDHSGYLRGDYADVCGTRCVFEPKERFWFDRSESGFEQVMAYYAVTKAQRYLRNLGFTDVNEGVQEVKIRSGVDNSFYDPGRDLLVFGKGGVDDAEDMDIIWHEYGHAILDDQVPGFGTSQSAADARAIGEGFGDYWAFTMSAPLSDYEPACIGDWDSVTYTTAEPHCLRRVDLDLTVNDRNGSPHHDGQIWSRALYDIHLDLGRETTDRIVITAQFAFATDVTFEAAAQIVVDVAADLEGAAAASVALLAFQDRGILP